ncbi:MAG: DNA gyrase inhibitor YacG [Burkholderia plantarii]|nr:MAG: DNA gyrase inhibitor YacG [Burkholderia plantarii]
MTLVVKCPACAKDVCWVPENRFRPFCSERCKQFDLGAWAAERYRIDGNDGDSNSEDDNPGGNTGRHDGSSS